MRTTAAVREFTDDALPDAELHAILDDARFAPSGGNRQGWHVIVVRDAATRRRLRELYQISWREYVAHVAEGKVPFAPGPDRRWTEPAVDLEAARATERPNPFADHLDEVPVMLVVAVDLTALAVLDNGLDRQSIVGGGSIYPFCHNLLLAARSRGYGGVLTTAICREEDAVRDLLGIPDPFAVAGLVALGRPVRQVTRLRRDPVDAFTTVDRFDGAPFTLSD
ncbi:nitroreductase family protein [Actinomarinicola tropica]|uniref:NADH dehydrogenase FAD-containing subunit n=1 Tax=Actinomarinicola tropica TaxID=2789776 RepID=A0A5Q2RSK2_9ACTN|nr:NADH dehydrogenase FAD-containing subunit [Actinomarinicola tropica]